MERIRKSFAKTTQIMDPPHLIAMQRESYEFFLQHGVHPEARKDQGLQSVFKSIFPIKDFNGLCSLDFVKYDFGEPKYTVAECLERGMTYEAPLKITVRLITFDVDEETKAQTVRDIKEQEVFLGALPLMTQDGVFIVNGTERVIVHQLQRSPGLFYTHDNGRSHASNKRLYSARIIPVRGSWLDFEFDVKDILYVRIDRRRKMPVTVLLKALGYNEEELLNEFYRVDTVRIRDGVYSVAFDPKSVVGERLAQDIVDPATGAVVGKKGNKITKRLAKLLAEADIAALPLNAADLVGRYFAHDVPNPANPEEKLAACNAEVTEKFLEAAAEAVTLWPPSGPSRLSRIP